MSCCYSAVVVVVVGRFFLWEFLKIVLPKNEEDEYVPQIFHDVRTRRRTRYRRRNSAFFLFSFLRSWKILADKDTSTHKLGHMQTETPWNKNCQRNYGLLVTKRW